MRGCGMCRCRGCGAKYDATPDPVTASEIEMQIRGLMMDPVTNMPIVC
jgi:hypothetical protein